MRGRLACKLLGFRMNSTLRAHFTTLHYRSPGCVNWRFGFERGRVSHLMKSSGVW